MRVALVHDYLNEFGGAERVLLALSEMYPDAPIYTAFYTKGSAAHDHFKHRRLIQTWFGSLPYAHKLISPLRFLIPLMWSSLDFSKYDVVISSSSWAVTRGFKKGDKTIEICYLHTPPRYLYGYDTSRNWQKLWFAGLVKIYTHIVNHFMRIYDYEQAQKVDYFIVNSQNIGKRLEKFYRRKVDTVIYPPVEFQKFSDPNIKPYEGDYYLTGGRFTAAKNFDLIIKAFNKLDKKLIVFGTGVQRDYLHSIARGSVEFVGRVDDDKLIALYKGAKAFIAAQKDEDFGITVVETAAAGCPAIVYKAEGYLESIVEGKTGIYFDELTEKSLVQSVKSFEKMKFNKQVLQRHAEQFSKERFKREINEFVSKVTR